MTRSWTSMRPSRALAILAFGVALLVTTAALPLLHDAFHAPGATEVECPVHILQVGFSLVLLAVVCLGAPSSYEPPRLQRRRRPGFVLDPCPTPLAPRAPPSLSV